MRLPGQHFAQKALRVYTFQKTLLRPKKYFRLIRAYLLRSGHHFAQNMSHVYTHYWGPKKLFHLIRAYFLCFYSLLRSEKTFSFNQGLFFEVGTPFCAKHVTCLYSLLRSEKTFLFKQGIFFGGQDTMLRKQCHKLTQLLSKNIVRLHM